MLRIKVKDIIRFEILFILYIKLGIDVLGIPQAAWYLCDVLNIILLFFAVKKIPDTFLKIHARFLAYLFVVFVVCTLIGLSINSQSIYLYVWGWRNIGRMIVFFAACIVMLEREDIYVILHDLYVAFIVNFILTLIQYFFYGIKGDELGGIFGISGASNSFTLNLLFIVTTLAVLFYLQKEIPLSKLLVCVAISVLISPLVELKAFYLLFILSIVLAVLLQNKMSPRILGIIILGCLGIFIAFQILSVVFPDSVEIFTEEGIRDYLTDEGGIGYSTTKDLSRTGAISEIHELFFEDDSLREIFGFGLGSCETSSISIFNSSFYQRYEYLHYRWFFHAMTYLELGLIGLIMYMVYFVSIFRYVCRNRKYFLNGGDRALMIFSQIMPIYTIIIANYNSSLRIESGYLVYFSLSIPFILMKSKKEINQYDVHQKVFKIFRKSRFTISFKY